GRGYTMINKYVASAAHLKGKRLISCEELTNTDVVFNETLELMKITGDLSTISGVTHPVFHGFNYSPPDAPFPGWIRYGCYLNERNTYWPYFRYFNDYRARISALLQHADMFADIAVLPPVADMWSIYGAQNEPFPSLTYPTHLSLVWEAMHQNGNGCDYISETIVRDGQINNGCLHYGPRKYHTLFMVQVESVAPATAEKLLSFVQTGGRIFCLDSYPNKSLGLHEFEKRDAEVKSAVEKMKAFTDRFILLTKPEKEFIQWYKDIQHRYNIVPYVRINKPDRFVTQVRYQAKGTEILFFVNSSLDDTHLIQILPSEEITKGRQAWVWNAVTGERFKLESTTQIKLDLGPADSAIIVFDDNKKGPLFKPLPLFADGLVLNDWQVEFQHINGTNKKTAMTVLKDLKDLPEYVAFSGTAIYRTIVSIADVSKAQYLGLGKVYGISEAIVNGKSLGVQWFGRRIYPIKDVIKAGDNTVEIRIITTMGNYMKTRKDNPVAQYWTNEKRKDQPIQSMGMTGPVTVS
ncbi:MAG: glycoside hydrolase family 2, partial [Bacteroidota bacterium]|nr:glycoside hydrolase family 2 [Bacteroidota bacterium]